MATNPTASLPQRPLSPVLARFAASERGELIDALGAARFEPSGASTSATVGATYRLAFVAGDAAEFEQRRQVAITLAQRGVATQQLGVSLGIPTPEHARVAVLFPGQGSQYVGMLQDLVEQTPALFEHAQAHLEARGRSPLRERLYPHPPPYSDEEELALRATEWAQPSLGVVSATAWSQLQSMGLAPIAFAGHSYGELVALFAAGAFDASALWEASRSRGDAMADGSTDRGTMAAVAGSLEAIQGVLDQLSDGVVLANLNHPRQGVISGSRAGIERALEALAAAELTGKALRVSAAFHSPLVADAAKPFAQTVEALPWGPLHAPVIANVTGAPYPDDPHQQRRILVEQITSPVRFVDVVQSLYAQGARTFVECGPGDVLTKLVRKILRRQRDAVALPLDEPTHRGQNGRQLLELAALLHARGVPLR